eukprot:CAMPEP_0197244430 /NCGR_PEP_ID=MMETSP1429-20130617/9558_1 /TAXON_ID=49237 /ORGANISM="Chaetoceros  sp., Strain UNC1202" /LENGTH=208 /DNA_ID=CAMNT_0042704791 /DNA_START=1 /DNA_END=628 /DNA_ORIENTATION=+
MFAALAESRDEPHPSHVSLCTTALVFKTHAGTKAVFERPHKTPANAEWADFEALDDDLDDEPLPPAGKMSELGYADENDPQEYKAEIGSSITAPEVDWEGEPLFLPQGSALPLTEENVQAVLAACRIEIGTMFGYTAENRGVGISGGVDFVDFDGPSVIIKLNGRFWHQRPTVLDRVEKYIQGRIPEVVECLVEDPYELTDEANNNAY